jgi:hypothetical protein
MANEKTKTLKFLKFNIMNKLHSNFKKIALSLLVVGLAVGFSAFKSSNKFVTHYGILSQNATTYTVEVFSEDKDCLTSQPSKDCSFDYPTAGQTSISKTDPNISSLLTNHKYQ